MDSEPFELLGEKLVVDWVRVVSLFLTHALVCGDGLRSRAGQCVGFRAPIGGC